jgi:hypothetical protein
MCEAITLCFGVRAEDGLPTIEAQQIEVTV